ncbi:CHAD domain-containing protein [Streptomyces sp. NPDC001185]|uniref:CHAD domain-containing protein n=1 Tax=Streptomyces sp. NPDC001185 TaxID=3154380 RepID=UPI00331B325A
MSRSSAARPRTLDAPRSPRYLTLLDSLTGLTEQPPLRRRAADEPGKVLGKAVIEEFGRLAGRVEHALERAPGTDRDTALHQARKAAKKTRYATEPARASLGEPAKRLGRRVKAVQKALGEHQDSVVARATPRDLAPAAHAAGETGFTWGLLYGREKAVAERCERELPAVWAAASKPGPREALTRRTVAALSGPADRAAPCSRAPRRTRGGPCSFAAAPPLPRHREPAAARPAPDERTVVQRSSNSRGNTLSHS